VLADELERALAIEAHLGALVGPQNPSRLRVVAARFLRRRRRAGDARHVVDPAARAQRLERVHVVRLPERAAVGGQCDTADLDAVAYDPRRHHERSRHDRQRCGDESVPARAPQQPRADDEWQQQQPHVAQDRDA
jgi:hypothetical protein